MRDSLPRGVLIILIASGLAGTSVGAVSAAPPKRTAPSNAAALPWLKNVEKIEATLISLGAHLADVGKTNKEATALKDVRRAEKDDAKAISQHKSGPKPPRNLVPLDKLLGRSLTEYRQGLRIIDKGFVQRSTSLISRGLKIVSKGTVDQNRFAAQLKNVK